MIALDLGLKRIGIAWASNGVIMPLKGIVRKNRIQAASEVDKILCEKNAKILIIGIANEEMGRRARHFVGLLKFGGEVKFVDESDTSKEAEELIKGVKQSRTLRKDTTLDSLSAMIILERYLGSVGGLGDKES